jgi:hypothetical protein
MRALMVVLLLAGGGAGCEDRPPLVVFPLAFSGAADDGAPLSGIELRGTFSDGASILLGATGKDGTLTTRVEAIEGSQLEVSARCPDGYDEGIPSQVTLALRSFVTLDRSAPAGLRTSFQCKPQQRLAAVVIRAGGKAGLPVLLDGKPIGETDAAGFAHLLVRVPASGMLQLGLDTTRMPALRPKNPVSSFAMHDADGLFVLDQPFQERAPPRKKRMAPSGPLRIESTAKHQPPR